MPTSRLLNPELVTKVPATNLAAVAEYRDCRDTLTTAVSLGRTIKLSAMFAVGLLGGFLLLNFALTRPLWRPPMDRFEQVLSELAASRDRVDLLFLGPSHMLTSVDPRLFDATMSARGHATYSYNLSIVAL